MYFRFQSPFLLLFCLLISCSDFDALEERDFITSMEILLKTESETSSNLQIQKGKDFSLLVKIYPEYLAESLEYFWFKKDSLLSKKKVFLFDKKNPVLPDSIAISDEAKNYSGKSFEVILNTNPEFLKWNFPKNGDTLYADFTEVIYFSFDAKDDDADTLQYTFKHENELYFLGTENSFYQSGFSPGKHSVEIIVEDPFFGKDTSSVLTFFVKSREAYE